MMTSEVQLQSFGKALLDSGSEFIQSSGWIFVEMRMGAFWICLERPKEVVLPHSIHHRQKNSRRCARGTFLSAPISFLRGGFPLFGLADVWNASLGNHVCATERSPRAFSF